MADWYVSLKLLNLVKIYHLFCFMYSVTFASDCIRNQIYFQYVITDFCFEVGWNTAALWVVEGDEKVTRFLGIPGWPCHIYGNLVVQVEGWLDTCLTALLCKKAILVKSKKIKTEWSYLVDESFRIF